MPTVTVTLQGFSSKNEKGKSNLKPIFYRPVRKVIVHKDYREKSHSKTYNDIALIRIATKFDIIRFGDRPTMPICLPKRKFKDNDKTGKFSYVNDICLSLFLFKDTLSALVYKRRHCARLMA